jgi:xanthine/uracil permease
MDQSLLRNIITIAVVVILFVIAFNVISWLAIRLLPVAVLVCAGYVVYKLVNKNK